MKKLNLKGINKESVIGILILVVALVNAVCAMFGIQVLPITNDQINETVSALFLIGTALYNTYKNRNITTASQKAQEITDAIKTGEVLADDIDEIISEIRKRNE